MIRGQGGALPPPSKKKPKMGRRWNHLEKIGANEQRFPLGRRLGTLLQVKLSGGSLVCGLVCRLPEEQCRAERPEVRLAETEPKC